MSRKTERVIVFDTTLRDGEQAAGVCFSARDKLEIACQLATMGVDVIEAGFPATSGAEHGAVATVSREVQGSTICALARAVEGDVDAAGSALCQAASPRIHVFLSASEVHMAHQLRRSRDQVLSMADAAVRRARLYTDDVEFSPMDATRASPDFLARVVRTALAAGASTINVPDTVGWILPDRLGDLLRWLLHEVPELESAVVSFHGQDDLGLATANSLAAIRAGARQVELAVNGIGERAGNTPFEEVLVALRVHGDEFGVHTDVDLTGIGAISRLVEERSGIPVPPNKPIVGGNAFRHASGVHQDGVLKNRETYEVIDPAEIGRPGASTIVLGKLSGRAGFRARAGALGFDLDGETFDRAFACFQALANRVSEVSDAEVRSICTEVSEDEGRVMDALD